MLLRVGSLCGLVVLGSSGTPNSSMAAPLIANVESGAQKTKNALAEFGEAPGSTGKQCDLKFPTSGIREFRFENYRFNKMKIRREAHWASAKDPSYVNDYKRALAIMKSLPESDPRSFERQLKIHCAYCDGAYTQLGYPDRNFRIHYSWLFAPFHRWYLYFFERILGSLINKPDFALPYWSWDNPKSMTIPPMFLTDHNSPLYDIERNQDHVNSVVDLNYANRYTEPLKGDNEQIKINLEMLRKSMGQRNRELFFGGKYKAGDEKAAQPQPVKQNENFGGGALEAELHNGVHAWVDKDMGSYSTAGRDPLFYAHHANVDRMWCIWKTLGEGRRDLDDPDYLGSSFVFWDENAQPVRVYVRDCLDNNKLGFQYECNYLPWNNSFPSDCATVSPNYSHGHGHGHGHSGSHGGWSGHGNHGNGGWGHGGGHGHHGGGGGWGHGGGHGHHGGGGGWSHGGGHGHHGGGGGWSHGGGHGSHHGGGGGGWGHGGGHGHHGGGGGWGHGGGHGHHGGRGGW